MRVDLSQFERAYAAEPDPWNFAGSRYEQRRFAITIASLPRARYRRCFEPGCAVGALTRQLSERADQVIAMEASPTASREASRRLGDRPNVSVVNGSIPENWPDGMFDLVVWSELGYYWDATELKDIVRRAGSLLAADGHLAAVHWLGSSDDHVLSGYDVHAVLGQAFGAPMVHHVDTHFLLDIWRAS